MVVAVATVTVPFILLKEPVRLSVIVSILLSSPTLELIDVKNIWKIRMIHYLFIKMFTFL